MGGNAIDYSVPFNYEEGKRLHSFMLSFLKLELDINPGHSVRAVGSWTNDRDREIRSWGDLDLVVQVGPDGIDGFVEKFRDAWCEKGIWPDIVWNLGLRIISVPVKICGKTHQVDLMLVENLDYAVWIHTVSWGTKYSAAYRNILLMAYVYCNSFDPIEMFMHEDGYEIPVTWKRDYLDISQGLMRGIQSRKGKKKPYCKTKHSRNKMLLTNNVIGIHTTLFGLGNHIDPPTESFEKLFQFIVEHNDKHEWVFKVALQNFTRLKMDHPKELHDYFDEKE
jgi:hypothetical protein